MKSFSLRSQFVTLNDISMYPNTAELRGIANFQMRCLAFCFSLFTNCYLLFVIVTLVTQKMILGNCYIVNCNAWENQIDFLVYHLYGLTFDEVLIVDPDTPFSREEYEAYKGE